MRIQFAQNKTYISFTWDDNAQRHFTHIAPLFLLNNLRCTFYVVPGDHSFDDLFYTSYAELSSKGFEIGSHSNTHQFMTTLSEETANSEFVESLSKISQLAHQYPISFAFPNHDFNSALLIRARQYHLETRNTLANSTRCSIKRKSCLEDLINAVEIAVTNGINLVFSGHSITTQDELNQEIAGEGYEPMQFQVLENLISHLANHSGVQVKTFAQMALQAWCKEKGKHQIGDIWEINEDMLAPLAKFNITKGNIFSYL